MKLANNVPTTKETLKSLLRGWIGHTGKRKTGDEEAAMLSMRLPLTNLEGVQATAALLYPTTKMGHNEGFRKIWREVLNEDRNSKDFKVLPWLPAYEVKTLTPVAPPIYIPQVVGLDI